MANKETLSYELGVLMFNLVVDEVDTVISIGDYDMMGNFCSIMDALTGEITLDDLKDGFIAEAENYHIGEEEALTLFHNAKQRVIDY